MRAGAGHVAAVNICANGAAVFCAVCAEICQLSVVVYCMCGSAHKCLADVKHGATARLLKQTIFGKLITTVVTMQDT